jgi:hypothetical protein
MKKILKYFPFILFFFLFTTQNLPAQGKWEFGFHYSQWSIDILGSLIEDGISDALEENLRDNFLEEIQQDHPYLEETSYNQEVDFDSGGDNYGFEIRWYPKGEYGSFSLGLSIEKTTMRVSLPSLSTSMSLQDQVTQETASFRGDASGAQFKMSPLSFHLSFRWDIKPSSKIHPYFTFGVGMAGGSAIEEGIYSVTWSGDLEVEGEPPEHYEGTEEKTLKELKEEIEEDEEDGEDFFLPGILPFIQLNFGVKGELAKNLYLLIDVGIWNGFLIRGGLSFRI